MGDVRYKSRIVAKGYQQIPGLDYTERFAPVVSNILTRMVFALTLWFGWVCHAPDVNAAFLKSLLIGALLYCKWPSATKELGIATAEEINTTCLRMKKC